MVGDSNNARMLSSTPNRRRTRESTCIASSECPPRSTKRSWIPTRCNPSTSAHTPASASSTAVRGATYSADGSAVTSSRSSARRSTLPLGVSGNACSQTNADGTMGSGSFEPRYSRISPVSGSRLCGVR